MNGKFILITIQIYKCKKYYWLRNLNFSVISSKVIQVLLFVSGDLYNIREMHLSKTYGRKFKWNKIEVMYSFSR